MKLTTLIFAMLVASTAAFVREQPRFIGSTRSLELMAQVELAPEPEGGEEVTAISSMAGSRLKNMGENSDIKSEDGTVYKFWLLSEAEASLIKEIRIQVLKDAKQKAEFPGFRKVRESE
jgi:hypothetical protein